MDEQEMIAQFVKWARLSRENAKRFDRYGISMAHFARGQAKGYMLCARAIKGYATMAICNNKPKFLEYA